MLKPYHEHEAGLGPVCVSASPDPVKPVTHSVELSSADPVKSVSVCVVELHRAELTESSVGSVTSVGGEEDVVSFSAAMVQGRLENSKMITELECHLAHLPEAQRDNIVEVIMSHKSLFSVF